MKRIARFLNIGESAVYGVVTFYAQFYLTPQGRHKIKVCQGTACHVRGSDKIIAALEEKLGIRTGETTPDRKFSLERVACFGSCALAPVLVIDEKVYGNVTPEQALQTVEDIP
jgi:NADH-quinone oxidoreductase subunit E